jgi:hypothetical protein
VIAIFFDVRRFKLLPRKSRQLNKKVHDETKTISYKEPDGRSLGSLA